MYFLIKRLILLTNKVFKTHAWKTCSLVCVGLTANKSKKKTPTKIKPSQTADTFVCLCLPGNKSQFVRKYQQRGDSFQTKICTAPADLKRIQTPGDLVNVWYVRKRWNNSCYVTKQYRRERDTQSIKRHVMTPFVISFSHSFVCHVFISFVFAIIYQGGFGLRFSFFPFRVQIDSFWKRLTG